MKHQIKQVFFIICAVVMLPVSLSYLLLSRLVNKDALLATYSQWIALMPGRLGAGLRAGFYRFALTQCAPDALISFMVLLSQQDTELGAGCYIGPQCNIGKCSIGKNTLLGSGVHVMSGKGQHNFADPDTPIKYQGGTFTKVEIGEDCWIGNGALIMANVGPGSVVAAGAVVTKEVPAGVIVAGNPAVVVRKR